MTWVWQGLTTASPHHWMMLQQSVISFTRPDYTCWCLPLRWILLLPWFASKVYAIISYTIIRLFTMFTKLLHFSLSMHITFKSLSSIDLASHAIFAPSDLLLSYLPYASRYWTILVNRSQFLRPSYPDHLKKFRSTLALGFFTHINSSS